MGGTQHSVILVVKWALHGLLGFGLVYWGTSFAAADPYILPVPNIVIYPGDIIKDNRLVDRDFTAEFPKRNLTAIDSRTALIGKVARRTLFPGSPIPLNAVGDPRAVANGAKVRLLYEDGTLAIISYGTALQPGSVGEVISVRNLGSGLTVSGTVQADGSVRVGGS